MTHTLPWKISVRVAVQSGRCYCWNEWKHILSQISCLDDVKSNRSLCVARSASEGVVKPQLSWKEYGVICQTSYSCLNCFFRRTVSSLTSNSTSHSFITHLSLLQPVNVSVLCNQLSWLSLNNALNNKMTDHFCYYASRVLGIVVQWPWWCYVFHYQLY